ncbi:MAG: YraN family protein [Actinomycetota bacterium]
MTEQRGRSRDRRSDAAQFGRFGEAAAARWYRRAGYRVLAHNWHCREGELDLIVARDGAVTFVEVKARADDRYGTGAEAVGFRKQRRIRTAALRWLDQADGFVGDIRFDVVEVDRRGRLQLHHDCF